MVNKMSFSRIAIVAITTSCIMTQSFAGGLSDPIIETDATSFDTQDTGFADATAQAQAQALPGWVVPAAALLLLGAVAASSSGGSSSSGSDSDDGIIDDFK